ncbi:MAG: bifunctional phosphoribosyl-AMP cyclohydrolase/phosphoribosyl-ATP diphosphatase HisIE [Thermodesulfobacteriota bacterium]
MDISRIKFDEKGLVPAIAQEAATGEVLMLAYMNAAALSKTLSTGRVHYYSRSRSALWLKGETSGNFQEVVSLYYDCDMDTILVKVRQTGVACHTGARSCFFTRIDGEGVEPLSVGPRVLSELYEVLTERKTADPEDSYVASLYKKGQSAILGKVTEEAGEFVEAAEGGVESEIVHELADLWFHSLILLSNEEIDASKLYAELERRFGTSGHEEKAAREEKG